MRYDTLFFYQHGSKSHVPTSNTSKLDQWWSNAEQLANARARAADLGYTFTWEEDETTNREHTDEGPEYALFVCLFRDQQGKVIGSLCGIDLGPDGNPFAAPYARVVEAELVLEHST